MKLIIPFIVGITLVGCGSSAAKSATTTKTTTPSAATTAVVTAAPPVTTAAAGSSTASSAAPAATTAASTAAATVILSDSKLGKILTTADGMTLYMFTPDSADKSACSGGCAKAWPPLVGPGTPGAGLDASDFGTLKRDDGTEQVTFYGHPLYTFASDTNAGDTNGQGSGGKWFAVGGDGNAAGSAATTTTSGY